MHNKKLSKIYASCALTLAFTMAVAPINAFAAGGDPVTPAAGSAQKIDPTVADYADTDISVWGITKDRTVYSVDVEWGAMTFEYETGVWNPETHALSTEEEGKGWLVYDEENDKVLGDVQDAINRVTVTNHSNAAVYATLTYTGEADYGVTTGTFAALNEDKQTETEKASANKVVDFSASFNGIKGVITLEDADNGEGEGGVGKPTVGNVYFMPSGIADAKKTADGIAQWTTIGKITVALSTTDPTTATPPESGGGTPSP